MFPPIAPGGFPLEQDIDGLVVFPQLMGLFPPPLGSIPLLLSPPQAGNQHFIHTSLAHSHSKKVKPASPWTASFFFFLLENQISSLVV